MDQEEKEEFTDLVGQHFESFMAVLVKALPGSLRSFGVGNRIKVGGEDYRYFFTMAKEGTKTYNQMEDTRRQVESE